MRAISPFLRGVASFAVIALAGYDGFAATAPTTQHDESAVVVSRLQEPIPTKPEAVEPFIWSHFSERPEIRNFRHYTIKNRRANFARFKAALVAKAREGGFEWDALAKSIDDVPALKIDGGRVAYLPIGAYRAKQGRTPVWVVLCLWEIEPLPSDVAPPRQPQAPTPDTSRGVAPDVESRPAPFDPEKLELGHIRMFTFDIKTGELVGFVTCG